MIRRNAARRLRFVVVVSVLLVGTMGLVSTSGAVAHQSAPIWRSSRIVNHHFVAPLQLDGDGVIVTPDLSLRYPAYRSNAIPGNSFPSAFEKIAQQAWSTSQLASYKAEGLGLGEVTIHDHVAGVPPVLHEKAWIGVAYFNTNEIQCPAEKSPPPHLVSPRWSGWSVVVIGLSSRAPAVVYKARSEACERIWPASLSNALEVISVPWRIKGFGPTVIASLPSCAKWDAVSDDGSVNGPSTLAIFANRPDDLALRGCAPAHDVVLPQSVAQAYTDPVTLHGPVGPSRQVGSP